MYIDILDKRLYDTEKIQKKKRRDIMGPRFDETPRGRRFFESDLPKLIKAIQELAEEMKRSNDLKEKELGEVNTDGGEG